MLRAVLTLAIVWLCWWGSARADAPPALEFVVKSFQVEGTNPLSEAASVAALAPFLGLHTGIDRLLAATDALNVALRDGGFSFYRATLPPQALDRGTVTLKIVAFGLHSVSVRGQQHFSEASIERSLPALVAGAAPNTRAIARDLAVANEHPSKTLKVNFRESEELPDMLDAVVNVSDERPWNLFAGVNDIGTAETGRSRVSVGGQYTDLTGHDDILSGSFTTSFENFNDVRQYAGFYQLPLYGIGSWLNAFYVHSDVAVGNVQNVFDVSGAGEFVGLSLRHPLLALGRYHHAVSAGLQDRLFDTAVSLAANGQTNLANSTKARSRPLSLRYDGGYNWRTTSLDFYLDFNQNLSFGGHNHDLDYEHARHGANASWKALRFGALVTQRLPYDFSGVARMTGQYANEPLLPGEELGFGGAKTVRGFAERVVAGDKGLILNFELWSPPITRLLDVRLLGFVDIGHKVLEQHDPRSRQRPNDTLSSVGVGARWQWHKQLTLAVDYGLPLAHASGETADRGTSKWHLDLQYRY